jgi:4-hydroxyphenylacetate 3-monooxygenase
MPDARMQPDQPVVGEGFIGAGADDEGPGGGFMAGEGEEIGSGSAERKATIDELMTGDEYVESLRDGRSVYIYGEKVNDVTTHPAFRNAVLSTRRLYDAMHDPATRDKICDVDQFGIRTHKFFHPAYSPADLLGGRDAIAEWSRLSYGFMGRTPDYKAAFMASLGGDPDWWSPFADNARNWYRKFASKGLFLNHVLINPPIDRKKPVHEVSDVYVHVVRETDGGIIVRGAKMLATASALTHGTFVAQNSAVSLEAGKAEDYALVFFVPMSEPKCKLLSRTSYEQRATSPYDYPLSSRFDENDAVAVFDDVFVPWENVLVYRNVDKAMGFYAGSGFFNRFQLQATTRLAVKMDFMCGLIWQGVSSNGTESFRGVQASVGEVILWRNLLWLITSAMALDPEPLSNGMVIPKVQYAAASRLVATSCWNEIHRIFETTLGGAPLVAPSSTADMQNPELRPLIDTFYRGSDGTDAEHRVKLFKLIWDTIGTEFGARHELYERNYSGNQDQIRLDALRFSRNRGDFDQFNAFVEKCMSEYDLGGWTASPWADAKW